LPPPPERLLACSSFASCPIRSIDSLLGSSDGNIESEEYAQRRGKIAAAFSFRSTLTVDGATDIVRHASTLTRRRDECPVTTFDKQTK